MNKKMDKGLLDKGTRIAKGKGLYLSLFLVLSILALTTSHAQTFSEWFRQKKTQKQYLAEQIIALQLYGGYLKKGYDIASSGLGLIRGFRDGEFGLHTAFFASLSAVSPAIRDDVKVAETIALQIAIITAFGGMNSGNHAEYVRSVKDKVLEDCGKDLSELVDIVLSGKVEMDDEERIRRLEKVHASMRDKAAFTQHFTGDVRLLALMQKRETEQIEDLKNWFSHEND
ncbi:hypothetical protein [Parapedobacter defluvii]|nr:hypothetical protein [Parapedobacter defluvii]